MKTITAIELEKNMPQIFEEVLLTNERVKVNTRNGNVILLSDFEYRSLKETLAILNNPALRKKLDESMKEDKSSFAIYNVDESGN